MPDILHPISPQCALTGISDGNLIKLELKYHRVNVAMNDPAMDSQSCKWFGRNEGDCRGVSPGTIFLDFVRRNVATPSEFGELAPYVLLVIVAWYALLYAVKFLLTLVKPVLIVVAALFLFRFLRTFDSTNMKNFLIQYSSLVMDGVSKAVELFMRLLD